MMDAQRGIASFVLRFTEDLFQDERGEPRVQWLGQIRHVQGNEDQKFTDLAEALRFIQRHLTQLTLDSIPEESSKMEQEKFVGESFKLWEQFASSYSNLMFEAMERTIKQSETLRQQMDQAAETALKAWRLPLQADQAQIVEALNRLQAQVQTLTARLEQLEKKQNG